MGILIKVVLDDRNGLLDIQYVVRVRVQHVIVGGVLFKLKFLLQECSELLVLLTKVVALSHFAAVRPHEVEAFNQHELIHVLQ